jgi:Xaa-Pro aminopeptidase
MRTNRRTFLKTGVCSVAALGALPYSAIEAIAAGRIAPASAGLALDTLQPGGKPFRLTETWYRQTIKKVQQKLGERGLKGVIVRDGNNLNYVAGTFLVNTERPAWLWVPTEGELAIFGPGLDRDMYDGWFIRDVDWYFDYPHAGPFKQILFEKGPTVDLTEWMLKGIAKRGGGEGKIGVENELTPSQHKRMTAVLPKAEFVPFGDVLLNMRMRKTPEEIVLTQVAIDFHDKTLEWTRNLIAEKGVGMYDAEVRRASQEFAENLVFSELEATGRPHQAVGVNLGLSCRAGIATAYPHPNQYFRKRIAPGDAIQLAAAMRVGGYGGEGYRALHLEPVPELARKMWEVHTEMTLAQAEFSKPGLRCQDVAEKVLQIAKKAGMQKYVYHRPAHGEGMEGHQPPYIALGDTTVLDEGMMFSNEPGLYNPQDGYGYNHGNNILITATGARRMNNTPLTREFCLIKTKMT